MTTTSTLRRLGAGLVAAATGLALLPSAPAAAAPARQDGWSVTPTQRQQAVLNDVAARGDEAWAVGADLLDGFQDQRPLALHWTDGRWRATPQPVGSDATLESVALAGRSGAWAVGEVRSGESSTPLVLRWQGSRWHRVPGPRVPAGAFDDVVVGPGGVWVTGYARVRGAEHAVVYRYAKGRWHAMSRGLAGSINGNALAVTGRQEAWLGLNAGIAHFEGHRWVLADDVPTDGSDIPTALAVAGDHDVWAVGVHHGGDQGEQPLVLHHDGQGWDRVPTPDVSAQLYDVVLDRGEPVIVGERFETDGDVTVSRPLVARVQDGAVVTATSPTDAEGALTGAAVADGRLWAVGLTQRGSRYKALAAYTDDLP